MRTAVILLSLAALIYIALILLLFLFQKRLVFFPSSGLIASPADIGLKYETVTVVADDGVRLYGWYIPTESDYTVLFFHGNAGNISHRLASIALFHQLGLNVFIIDYRGYGQSEGSPDEQGTYLDAEAAWTYLVNERGLAPDQIILFGRSLGGAVATQLATRHQPKALILESTFTSIPDMAARQFPFLPVRLLTTTRYPTIERIRQIDTPLLVIHSRDDEIIPYNHGRQIFEAAPEPKQFLDLQGTHNEGFLTAGDGYREGLRRFIEQQILAESD